MLPPSPFSSIEQMPMYNAQCTMHKPSIPLPPPLPISNIQLQIRPSFTNTESASVLSILRIDTACRLVSDSKNGCSTFQKFLNVTIQPTNQPLPEVDRLTSLPAFFPARRRLHLYLRTSSLLSCHTCRSTPPMTFFSPIAQRGAEQGLWLVDSQLHPCWMRCAGGLSTFKPCLLSFV